MTKQSEEIEVLVTLAGTHDKAFAFVHLGNGSNLATVRAKYAEDVAALIRAKLNPEAVSSEKGEPRGCPTPGACSCPSASPAATGATALLQRWYDLYGESTCDRNEEQDAMLKLDRETREYLAAAPRVEEETITDAARYRHVRGHPEMLLHLSNKDFDAAIDKARGSRMKSQPSGCTDAGGQP